MTMNAQILDKRDDGNSRCYLAKVTLEDYVAALPQTYQDYDVQREIVSNVYLDKLVETVLEKRHIPPIVLVVDDGDISKSGNSLTIETFKILDGLQRTFRLKAIRETIDYCLSELQASPQTYLEWNKFKFSRQFSTYLRELNSNTDVLRAVLVGLDKYGAKGLLETFSKNMQWFEIWTGLSPDEEVRKMLTLNAGHKPVKTRHQLELLFLNLLPVLRKDEGDDFRLVREKEVGSTQFSKGRVCGSFHFAHIITALLSFFSGKPVAPSTDLIQDIQSSDNAMDDYSELMNPDFLKKFISFLVKLDQVISNEYEQLGIMWMGREVSLAGLFGALGSYADETEITREAAMDRMLRLLRSDAKKLRLDQFEKVRNSVELSKVNIGNVNRTAIYSAIRILLLEPPRTFHMDWRKYFGASGK
jgi:hypothetical protein